MPDPTPQPPSPEHSPHTVRPAAKHALKQATHPAEESHLLGHQLIRPRRFVIPHPLVALAGAAGVFGIYQIGQARGWDSFLDYGPWLAAFLLAFSYVSRRSARNQALRQQQELDRLRQQPVWGLDQDPDQQSEDFK